MASASQDTQQVWPAEMNGRGQHLHFAIFSRYFALGTLDGSQGRGFVGIWYVPKGMMTVSGQGASGSGTVDLIYRPCDDKADPCASGLGTELIQ